MPPSRREYLKRRCRQADHNLAKAQDRIATIHKTVVVQHPELGPRLSALIGAIDGIRRDLLMYYRVSFAGSERGLWKSEDMDIILEQAQGVPDPHYEY